MPHIIVEYSDHLALPIPNLLNELHSDLAARETADINAIKIRAIPVKDCVISDADKPNSFVHIALKLLPGRDDALKKEMAQGLHDTARHYIGDQQVALTVETITLEAETYIK